MAEELDFDLEYDLFTEMGPQTLARDLREELSPEIRDHFPFPEIRSGQERGLRAYEKAVRDDKKFVIYEAPTGVGKSGVAIAIASHAKTYDYPSFQAGAYILSPQKTLTKQYMNDFSQNGLLEMKGKANFRCTRHKTDCDTASHLNAGAGSAGKGKCCEACPYLDAKKAFISNPFGTDNFAYHLAETTYGGQLPNRNVLILDEGHNTESQILGFADTEITPKHMEEINLESTPIPVIEPGQNQRCKDWLQSTFIKACQRHINWLQNEIDTAYRDEQQAIAIKWAKQLDKYNKFVCRINRFMNSEELKDWLCYTVEEDRRKKTQRVLYIKPLTATLFGNDLLFRRAKRVVIMSATILDFSTFRRNLGIAREDTIQVAAPSDFPKEHRPIFFWPAGDMSHKKREATLPRLLRRIEKILDKHDGVKGIIHTHSYEINNMVVEYLRNTKHCYRIVTHTNQPGTREVAVMSHYSSPDATVLISPSMTEGLDLKDDLSRFQIICKVPYPYLDPYIKARMARDPAWYQWQTALTIIQATGRSIRNMTDTADTYILDFGFEAFLNRNQYVLPEWWTDAVEFVNEI